jgi:hypothetical protein
MAPLSPNKVELLVHAAAPSTSRDDTHYRSQAAAYLESQDEWTRLSNFSDNGSALAVNPTRSFTPVNTKSGIFGAPGVGVSAVTSLAPTGTSRHSIWDSTTQREVQDSIFDEGQNRDDLVPVFEVNSNFSQEPGQTQQSWEAVATYTIHRDAAPTGQQVGVRLTADFRPQNTVDTALTPSSASKTKLGYHRNGLACGTSYLI